AQLAEGRCEVENQYKRVVSYEGNPRALQVMAEVFELRPHFEWRGLGFISQSGLKLSDAYADLDAERRFAVPGVRVADPKACQCGAALAALADAGAVDGDLALSTDSFVVKPLRFPGGSIGELAVNGTVNDLAVAGARALALSVALILEEGLPAEVLRAEVEAIAAAAAAAGVEVVTGDAKVVERGHADAMYVCTTGIGRRDPRAALPPAPP